MAKLCAVIAKAKPEQPPPDPPSPPAGYPTNPTLNKPPRCDSDAATCKYPRGMLEACCGAGEVAICAVDGVMGYNIQNPPAHISTSERA